MLDGIFYEGAMLTGAQIQKEVDRFRIHIDGFTYDRLNPNSYNIRIGNTFKTYKHDSVFIPPDHSGNNTYTCSFDLRHMENVTTFENKITKDGVYLLPGEIYLIPTYERISSDYYIPLLTGRSSIGRLGITVHQEAGFGDLGFDGIWTLQVKVTYPTKIYPYMELSQVYFMRPYGLINDLYNGRYQGAKEAIASRFRG